MKRLLLIMPAYNEGQVIKGVLRSLKLSTPGIQIDRLVVNDGSSDDTATQAIAGGAFVLSHIINSGSGGATATGLEFARDNGYNYAVTIDADGQHTSKDCQAIISELAKDRYDLVIGSRLINSEGMPWYRVVGNAGLSFITFLLFGRFVTDSQSGLKGFSRKALETIQIKSEGMEFCSEIIWRAKQNGLKVKEIPIQAIYTKYSLAKGQSNWNAIKIIGELIKRKVLETIDV